MIHDSILFTIRKIGLPIYDTNLNLITLIMNIYFCIVCPYMSWLFKLALKWSYKLKGG